MKQVIQTIIELQKLHFKLKETSGKLAAIPGKREKLENALSSRQAEYDSLMSRVDSIGKDRRAREGDLALMEERISKYKTQLMSVKTNKEYDALKHEITAAQEQAGDLETKILVSMDENDRVSQEAAQFRTALDAAREEHGRQMKRLDEQEETLLRVKSEIGADLKETEEMLPASVLDRYRKVAGSRDGVVIAAVTDANCGACNMRIRPQLILELKKHDQILSCENCQRFLYWCESSSSNGTLELEQEQEGHGGSNGTG